MIKKIINYFLEKKFIRFSVSGGIATLVDVALLYILTEYVGIWYLISAVFSFMTGSITHFVISRHWVFKDLTKTFWRQYKTFLTIHLGGLSINLIGLFVLVEYFKIYYILAKFLVVILGISWTFFGNKKFTFKNE